MAILVDGPRWQWQGRRWAHLVSDQSYDELHEFARRLGKRRLGFQGDHYDVDETDHARAVDLGAAPTDARELIRRLRAAGLRTRDGKPRWRELGRWPDVGGVGAIRPDLAAFGPAAQRLVSAIEAHSSLEGAATVAVFFDPQQVVGLLELEPGARRRHIAVDVDLQVIGEPRADGTSSIELFVHR